MLKKFLYRILDIRRIIKRKKAQIRAEREKLMAAETANRIYAAYILYCAAGEGAVRVPKDEIARTVGKYRADISASENEYIISVREIVPKDAGACAERLPSDRKVGECNGACAGKTGGEDLEKN